MILQPTFMLTKWYTLSVEKRRNLDKVVKQVLTQKRKTRTITDQTAVFFHNQ